MLNVHDSARDVTKAISGLKQTIDEQRRLLHKAGVDRDHVKEEVTRMREELDKKEKELQQKEIAIRRLEGDRERSNRELSELEHDLAERNRTGGGIHREVL